MTLRGYFCDECGGKPAKTDSWYVGKTWVDPETGNKGAQRFCSQECVVLYLLRRESERAQEV
jgi:hypothetical protein